MRQGPKESLWAYFKRFQAKRLEVNDPRSTVAMVALVAGLQSNELADSLAKKPIANYKQLMAKAHGYMDMEDAQAYKASARDTGVPVATTSATLATMAIPSNPQIVPAIVLSPKLTGSPLRLGWHKNPPRVNSHPNHSDRRNQQRNLTPKESLTILDTSLTNALTMVQREGYLKDPAPKMSSDPRSRDSKQYYHYHRDHRHITNDCRILKRDIEDLSERGHLRNLTFRRDRRDTIPNRNNRRSRSWGSSNNERKRYARRTLQVDHDPKKARTEELISFTDDDLQGVETAHDDPLVITIVINGYQVKRIMVDTGSSMDVLYTSTFNQMGIDKSRLLPCRGPLVSFTGHALLPEGMITLPFVLGEYPMQITIQI
ncbi:uncharacterized protein LOC109842200 [Asparagus officinalis]|uniref:uncharacterized protein LOC109842200 n=1 Tax=Asparagus officinalis TaxID=4686 RepID=UPI00098DFE0D|nr:uncharacterized protein LOC109842200 [Asparagus officinalis]